MPWHLGVHFGFSQVPDRVIVNGCVASIAFFDISAERISVVDGRAVLFPAAKNHACSSLLALLSVWHGRAVGALFSVDI